LKYYYICSIIRTEQALIEKTIAGLQLTAVGSVQAQDRVRVFLNPGLLGDYFDQHGQQGMRVLFSGVDEALIKGWADWHSEVIDSKSFQQDETLTALKDTLDEILESNPDGPLKNIRNEDWYSSSLVPASERRRFHWQNSIKRQDQITKIWGRNWGSFLGKPLTNISPAAVKMLTFPLTSRSARRETLASLAKKRARFVKPASTPPHAERRARSASRWRPRTSPSPPHCEIRFRAGILE
jgi:hypothetical protein